MAKPSRSLGAYPLRVRPLEDRVTPATLFGLTNGNTILRFDSSTPGTIDATVTITGLQPGELVTGIDFRPATGQLFALGLVDDGATRTGRVYTLDPATGAATQVGATPFTTTYPDTDFGGFDFNPTVDLIRIISRNGDNLRVSPNTGALVATDTNTDKTGLNGVSYTNNDLFGTTTTLFAYNFDTDELATIGGANGSPSPNTGQVLTIGATGFVAAFAGGLQVVSSAGTEAAFGTANGKLFSVNLATGTFTLVGDIGGAPTLLGLTAALETIAVAGTAGDDTLVLTATGANSGSYTLNGGPAVAFAGIKSFAFLGREGSDTLQIVNDSGVPFAPADGFRFLGGADSDTLVGPDGGAAFVVTGANAGTGAGAAFVAVENLRGGAGADAFTLQPAGSLTGTIDGKAGTDALSYASFSDGVTVNLGLSNNLISDLDGGQENPAVTTTATGTATVSYNAATRQATVALTVNELFNTITLFHIHTGAVGVNGPVIVDIGPGALAPTGTPGQFTANVVADIPAAQEAAFLAGLAYFNIHTGTFPGGEIRGQIVPGANVSLASGTATGTGGVANLENVTGGSGADSLIGTTAANVLIGGAGNDTLIGGPGADTLAGDADSDFLVWSNGDGSDVMDGGAGADTVQVNGSVTAGDVFTVGAGAGGRLDFDRVSPGPFSLDIGTVETLRVNGSRGDDKTTVATLAGVADLTAVSLAGLAGADTFTVTPSASVGVLVSGGTPTAGLGDSLVLTGGKFAAGTVTFTGPDSGTVALTGAGLVTFAGLEPVDMTGTAVDALVFNLPAGGSAAVLEDDGTAANGFSRLRSTAATFEATAFADPVTLTVNRGDILDTLTIAALPDFTGGLTVGTAAAPFASVTLGAAVGLAGDLRVVASGDILVNAPITAASVTLKAGAVRPAAAATDVTVSAGLAFGTGTALRIDIAGPAPDTEFSRLVVGGAIDLTGLTLALTGAYVPVAGDSLVIVSGTSVTGTFGGLVGDTVRFNGVDLRVVYSATAVTLIAPPPPAQPTELVGFPAFAIGSGPGGTGVIGTFNPDGTPRGEIDAFPGFAGGVRTAVGDFNGDGVEDFVAGTGPGVVAEVKVFDGKDNRVLFSIRPFETFTGGVFVAAGDLNGDGKSDLAISPDQGGGPRARVFRGGDFTQLADFFGIEDPDFRGGARVSIADVTGDGTADLIVAAGFGGGPRLAVFDGTTLRPGRTPTKPFADFFVFEQTLRNGVFVTGGDIDGDGFADIIAGGGPGGGPRVFAVSGREMLQSDREVVVSNFFAGDTASRGGIRVAVKDLDGDLRADLVVGAGTGAGSRVTGYLGRTLGEVAPPERFRFDGFPGLASGVFVG